MDDKETKIKDAIANELASFLIKTDRNITDITLTVRYPNTTAFMHLNVAKLLDAKNENTCVYCGKSCPEGSQICYVCNNQFAK